MTPGLFREEAVRHHAQGQRGGDVLRLSPIWLDRIFWCLLGLVGAAMLYAVLGKVSLYAAGPAVVRMEGRTDVVAKVAATVASVHVQPGQRVEVDALLVQLDDTEERSELASVERELEAALVRRLRNPADAASEQQLGALRGRQALARAHLSERAVRAPVAGVVGDVRIRAGQQLTQGQVAVSLLGDGARRSLIALLPGQYRPLLRVGMPLRLEVAGFSYAYQWLTIDALGDEVVGPAEARRFLGQETSDAVPISGPVVLVRATLPGPGFVSGGVPLDYFDGMQGSAEARVRDERILFAVVPALGELFDDRR